MIGSLCPLTCSVEACSLNLMAMSRTRNYISVVDILYMFCTNPVPRLSLHCHKISYSNNQNSMPHLTHNRLFYHPDYGWSREQPQPRSFSQRVGVVCSMVHFASPFFFNLLFRFTNASFSRINLKNSNLFALSITCSQPAP